MHTHTCTCTHTHSTNAWVTSYLNESYLAREWVTSHITWLDHVTHVNDLCHVTHIHESCHTYAWVTSHICMSHVTHMHESRHTWISHILHVKETMSHLTLWKHVTHANTLCHTCEYFMSHKCTIHMTLDVTHHMTLEWVIPHHTMDESHHPHICFRTHIWFTTYMWFVAHIVTSYMNESYLACERVHVTHHISGSHQTMNDSNHTRKWFTAHVCMSHVIHEGVISCM